MKMGVQWGSALFVCVCVCFFVVVFFCFFGGRGQGGYERERRIEVIVKIQKKSGEGGQVRVDVNEELMFL